MLKRVNRIQSQPLNGNNIPHSSTNRSPSMGIYCIHRPITTPQWSTKRIVRVSRHNKNGLWVG
eukprot:9494365-Pyramimonas_sp.AAC.1